MVALAVEKLATWVPLICTVTSHHTAWLLTVKLYFVAVVVLPLPAVLPLPVVLFALLPQAQIPSSMQRISNFFIGILGMQSLAGSLGAINVPKSGRRVHFMERPAPSRCSKQHPFPIGPCRCCPNM